MKTPLKHIALIPDGNRRWARAQGKTPMQGHEAGAHSSERVIEAAFNAGATHVTMWGCSVSNLTNRPGVETAFLKKAFGNYFRDLLQKPRVHDEGIRIRALGRWREYFTPEATAAVEAAIEGTKKYNQKHLTFLLGYSGTDEMLNAIGHLREEGSGIPTSEELKASLWTAELPPVDLVVRTGGEPHWSAGFMMWDVAEAQLHFTETLWPAFTPNELKSIIEDYRKTERRRGA